MAIVKSGKIAQRDFIRRIEWEPEHGEGAFSEMVTGPVDMVHIERMDDGCYWMGIYKDGKRQVVRLGANNDESCIYAATEVDD